MTHIHLERQVDAHMVAWLLFGIISIGLINIIDPRTLIENIRILVSYIMFGTIFHAALSYYRHREYKQTVRDLIVVIVCIVLIGLTL